MNVIREYFNEFNNGIKKMFKEFFNKNTNKKQRANMWTFSRLLTSGIIPILIAIGIITKSLSIVIAAFAATAFGALTDFFDGRSARKHNSSSEFGALLDAASDKAYTTLLGVGLSFLNPYFLINIAGELLITLTNLIYKIKHEEINMKSTKIGKIKQWPLSLALILGTLSILLPQLKQITNIAIGLTSAAQLATITSYVYNNNKQIKDLQEKDNKNIDINSNNTELDLTKQKQITSAKIQNEEKSFNYHASELNSTKPKTKVRKR